MKLEENEKIIDADFEKLVYSGRIDFANSKAPIFIFAGSSVAMRFTGTTVKILVKNKHSYHDNYLGYIIDGAEKKILLSNDDSIQEIILATDLTEDRPHEVTLFKRQDACHEFTFYGFIISKNGTVDTQIVRFKRCMEFYGDSAAAGEFIEADYCEENHNSQYSNAWKSYAMMTARNLKANVNIIAQEGIALLDNAGYFHVPNSIGMESIYDKLHYNPDFGSITEWDFKRYTPQVVIIDIGQNDAIPEEYMKKDAAGEKAENWKKHYREFVLNIRSKYPDALIVLTTTVMKHDPSWDRAIGQICVSIDDRKILHFLYSHNGYGTSVCGLELAEQMSFELSIFLKGLGVSIWHRTL